MRHISVLEKFSKPSPKAEEVKFEGDLKSHYTSILLLKANRALLSIFPNLSHFFYNLQTKPTYKTVAFKNKMKTHYRAII